MIVIITLPVVAVVYVAEARLYLNIHTFVLAGGCVITVVSCWAVAVGWCHV